MRLNHKFYLSAHQERFLKIGVCIGALALSEVLQSSITASETQLVDNRRYVEVLASIALTTYDSAGTNTEPRVAAQKTFPVKCIVGTHEWRIEADFSLNSHTSWFYDGTNVYSSPHITKDLSQSRTNRHNRFVGLPFAEAQQIHAVTIRPSVGGCPLDIPGVNLPWLMFCSGPYLQRRGRVVPLPCVFQFTGDTFAHTDKTETFRDQLGLPRTMYLFTSRAQYLKSLEDPRLVKSEHLIWEKANPRNVRDGNLVFDYMVHATTNVSTWTFPKECSFTQRHLDDSGKWKPFVTGKGTLLSIRMAAKPENVFSSKVVNHVLDYRFHDTRKMVDALNYRWTNSESPSTNLDFISERRAKQIAFAPTRPSFIASRTRWTIVYICVISIAAPIICGLRRKRSVDK